MKNKDDSELDYNRKMNFEMSKKRQEDKRRISQEIVKDRQAEARTIKQQSRSNDIKKQEIVNAYAARNHERKSKIRMQEEVGQQKVQKMREKKLKEFKHNYDLRIQEEMEKIKKREKELSEMEREEGELIKKLQNTQQVQKRAFNELETAIKSPSSGKASPKSNGQGSTFKEAAKGSKSS
eukprot:TRINITY_DN7586_c0_g1_i10.p1 TRINITY_DN7586_c0_g1~~TRINITY_DN7586_c0_g1_i10.p1  ORF type:complete len:180 (+),score=76.32 TRINITY_DN7586_c0_g1_i10:451-990(+)